MRQNFPHFSIGRKRKDYFVVKLKKIIYFGYFKCLKVKLCGYDNIRMR